MAWYPPDLPTFPNLPLESVQEKRSDPVKVVEFGGEAEQRISYAGPRRLTWEVKTTLARAATLDLFLPFWEGRQGQMLPFKFIWRQVEYYVRFDGQFTLSWRAADLGQISFSLKQMHPSEIIA